MIINEYTTWLELSGKSKNTIKTYSLVVKKFLEFLKNNYGISEENLFFEKHIIDKNVIFKFLANKKAEKNLDMNTIRLYVRAISSFLKFLELEDVSKQIKAPKVGKRLPKFITFDEFQKLLDNCKRKRDKLIIKFLFYTGVRVSELVNIKVSDILFDEGYVKVFGKGGKERIVPLPDNLLEDLKEYIKSQNLGPNDKLFNLSTRQIERIIKNTAIRAEINKKVTPHVLRHSLATLLLSKGVDIRFIQEILGHSSLSITQIYTHIVPKQLKEVYKNVFEKNVP